MAEDSKTTCTETQWCLSGEGSFICFSIYKYVYNCTTIDIRYILARLRTRVKDSLAHLPLQIIPWCCMEKCHLTLIFYSARCKTYMILNKRTLWIFSGLSSLNFPSTDRQTDRASYCLCLEYWNRYISLVPVSEMFFIVELNEAAFIRATISGRGCKVAGELISHFFPPCCALLSLGLWLGGINTVSMPRIGQYLSQVLFSLSARVLLI